jgi:hypothetical protein
MNLIELQRALRELRLGGMAAVLETRLRQALSEAFRRAILWQGSRPVSRRPDFPLFY